MTAALAIFILGFALLRLGVACINWWFRQPLEKDLAHTELVTVVVPVRNEALNIAALLDDLGRQTHRPLEILVFDDASTDETMEAVKPFMLRDKRIRLLHSESLPKGWLGKNHACHEASLEAKGAYLLFVDADVRLAPEAIALAVGHLKKQTLGLLSILPKQVMESLGEQVTVPLMNQILLSLLPLILVKASTWPAFSAANGQFMLFDAATYRACLPHARFRMEPVEDLRIAKFLKRQRIRVAFVASEPAVSCRMYRSHREALHGFSKNIVQIFGGSAVVACLYWLVTTFGFLPVWLAFGLPGLFLYVSIVVLMRSLVAVAGNQSFAEHLVHTVPQQVSLARIIALALWFRWRKKQIWKDRNISLQHE